MSRLLEVVGEGSGAERGLRWMHDGVFEGEEGVGYAVSSTADILVLAQREFPVKTKSQASKTDHRRR